MFVGVQDVFCSAIYSGIPVKDANILKNAGVMGTENMLLIIAHLPDEFYNMGNCIGECSLSHEY